ncbi:MAG: VanZ family protein [Oscillospiraceae bacterium]|nr:VanZ family protein [Oscillospiraceae bacterium]
MTNIYLWFYCLKMNDAIFLVLLATVLFLRLKARFCSHALWNATMRGTALIWFTLVSWTTVLNRASEQVGQEASWIPFYSYFMALQGHNPEALRSNFMNMVLFYPAGLLSDTLVPRQWKKWRKIAVVSCVCCALSVSIEMAQCFHHLGLAETDDVIHNTLGAVIGAWVCTIPMPYDIKSKPP